LKGEREEITTLKEQAVQEPGPGPTDTPLQGPGPVPTQATVFTSKIMPEVMINVNDP
jgi:hypothetical protein